VRLLVLIPTLLLSGCGVDVTREMWSQQWVDPPASRPQWLARTQVAAEYSGKALLTPVTVTVDVATDEVTWCVLGEALRVALECSLRCSAH
jgi:hypothetical protein